MRPSGDLAAADLGDDHDGRPGRPILPEVRPARRWGLVGRWSPEPVKGLGAIRGRVLHGHEQRLPVRREAWPAKLSANRHAIEQLRRTAPLALGLQAVKAVGSAGPRPVVALIGGDPQPAFIVHAGIIRGRRTSHCPRCQDSTEHRPRREGRADCRIEPGCPR
jgi:hypothetical protein